MCGYSVIIGLGLTRMTLPSLSAFFAASTAMRPPAPGLFSTTTAGA